MDSIAVLMTCHNRRELTLACLANLFQSAAYASVRIGVFLVDDASSDGTGEAVRTAYPYVNVIKGSGDLLWGGGMRKAYTHAISKNGFSAHLWLNDDTNLFPGALSDLIRSAEYHRRKGQCRPIVVGNVVDPVTKTMMYGGYWRPKYPFRRPGIILPKSSPVPCNCGNGNIVFVPIECLKTLGGIDESFVHALGDFDYTLRAVKNGMDVVIASGIQGECSRNPIERPFREARLGWVSRIKLMASEKGLPPYSWLKFTKRHHGLLWPLYFLYPYLKTLVGRFR